MSVRGSLRTMSVEDVLDWIDRRMLSGMLTIQGTPGMRAFAFDAGYMVACKSSAPVEDPEQVLLRIGLLDEEILGRAHAVQADRNTPLIESLREVAEFDEPYLRSVLELHASELMLDTWVWDDGEFSFETPDEATLDGSFPVSVRLRECIVKARQRAYRWRQIRSLIPSVASPLRIVDRIKLALDEDSEDVLEEILELTRAIEEGWSIARMIEQWHGWRFRVFDRLALLIERGGIAVGRQRPATGAEAAAAEFGDELETAANLVRSARAHAEASRTGKALELIERALRMDPSDASLQKFQGELERKLFAELSRDLLTSFRVPRLMIPRDELDRLDLSDAERYLAGRVDGRWDLLSLMRVAPVREVEALITFKRLADRGIISL